MEQVTTAFLDQGLLGAAIVALAIVVVVQWRENKALRDKMYAELKDTAISAINAQNASTAALNGISDKIEIVRRRDV